MQKVTSAGQAASIAMGLAELAGANAIAIVMANAALAEQACQQIELATVSVVCGQIIAAGATP